MITCKICGNLMTEEPMFEDAVDYGDFKHICLVCSSVAYECFGHGLRWNTSNTKVCELQNKCESYKEKCKTCKRKITGKQDYYKRN